MVRAQHDAVGVEEIGNRSAFPQKLGVRSDVERLGFSAVAKHYGTYPIAGVDGDSALLDNDFVAVNRPGNFSGDGFHIREISFASIVRRSSDRDKDC